MTFPRLQAPSLRLLRVLLLGCSAVLAGCHTVPYAKQGVLPPRIEVAEGSRQRAALNAQTYDATVRHVRRLFYRDTNHFTHIARERRASVIAQPGEDGFYNALKEVLATLEDAHSHAVTPSERAINEDVRRKGVKNAEIGYGHIGALSGWGESVLVVRPDSPASRAGILPGWQILSIDGQPSWMHEKQAQQ